MNYVTAASIVSTVSLMALCGLAAAQVPVALVVKQGDAIGGSTVSTVATPFTNANGELGTLLALADARRVIYSESGIVFDSATAPVALTGGETTIGWGEGGAFIYSPSTAGSDAAYTHNGLLLADGMPAPGFAGQFNSFNSRPDMGGNKAFWVAGLSATPGGATTKRVLYSATGGPGTISVEMQGGDTVGGNIITAQGISFNFRVSSNGLHRIHDLTIQGAPTTSDVFLAADGVQIAREGTAAPVGNYTTFRHAFINNSGTYVFAADTNAATTMDEIIVSNTGMVVQEGDVIGGVAITGICDGLSINNNGDVVFIYDTAAASGSTERLFRGHVSNLRAAKQVLKIGDLLDVNGDNVADYTLKDFNASTTFPSLDLGDDGRLFVTVTLNEIGQTTDIDAIIRVDFNDCGCAADYNEDGGVDGQDIEAFFAEFEDSAGCSDVNQDGGVTGEDVGAFFDVWEAGSC